MLALAMYISFFCVDFICVWYPTRTQFPVEYGLKKWEDRTRIIINPFMFFPQPICQDIKHGGAFAAAIYDVTSGGTAFRAKSQPFVSSSDVCHKNLKTCLEAKVNYGGRGVTQGRGRGITQVEGKF